MHEFWKGQIFESIQGNVGIKHATLYPSDKMEIRMENGFVFSVFNVTVPHMKAARRVNFGMSDLGNAFPFPQVSGYRPFGNSGHIDDLAEFLGISLDEQVVDEKGFFMWPEHHVRNIVKLGRSMTIVMECLCQNLSLEEGMYINLFPVWFPPSAIGKDFAKWAKQTVAKAEDAIKRGDFEPSEEEKKMYAEAHERWFGPEKEF